MFKIREIFWKHNLWPFLYTFLSVFPPNLDRISAWTAKWLWYERWQCQGIWTSHQLCQLPLWWHWTGRAGTWPRAAQLLCSHTGVPAHALPHPHPRLGRGLLHRPNGNQSIDKGTSSFAVLLKQVVPYWVYGTPKRFTENLLSFTDELKLRDAGHQAIPR